MDWNGDGLKDLIAGEHDGHIRIYLNVNTDEAPEFDGYTFLEVAGAPYDAGADVKPHLVDWNNDGLFDIVCGGNNGKIMLLLNQGTSTQPTFDAAVPIKDGNVDLVDAYFSSPAVFDANGDGKKDLFVGNRFGDVHFYENRGSDANPIFDGWVQPYAGAAMLEVMAHSALDCVDWDGDGMMDILCGEKYGYVTCFRAKGPLQLSDNAIASSTGGIIDLTLDAGSVNAGRKYLILGSVSGTEPGTSLPGGIVTLPINWDIFTDLGLLLLNTPVFHQFMGMLDSNGKATSQFNTAGPVPTAAGLTAHFAYALNNKWDFASNAAAVEVVP